MRKPNSESHVAVSVPSKGPDSMFASTKRAGKCFMRMRRRALKRETVCSGMSCFRETRKEAERARRPFIGVGLGVRSVRDLSAY